jgi:RNase P/RNase MRP subunit p30
MKKFYDLHLQVPLSDFELVECMIQKAAWLGYAGVGIPLPHNISDVAVSKLRQLCMDSGIDLVTRFDLAPKNADELLFQLRRNRRRFEIVAVSCSSKAVARQAAKDRRVDLLLFPSLDFRNRYFDDAEAELAASALTSLEINMSILLSATSYERINLLTNLRRETTIAKKFSVPVVVSSGAKTESLIHKPQDFAALAYLFDMPLASALKTVSENPLSIIIRNRTKLLSSFVAPGIRIVKRGKDC